MDPKDLHPSVPDSGLIVLPFLSLPKSSLFARPHRLGDNRFEIVSGVEHLRSSVLTRLRANTARIRVSGFFSATRHQQHVASVLRGGV